MEADDAADIYESLSKIRSMIVVEVVAVPFPCDTMNIN